MATHQIRPANKVAWISKDRSTVGPISTDSLGTPANYTDMTALDTRLTAIDSTAYSQANLDSMTLNDKIYALRLNDDASTGF